MLRRLIFVVVLLSFSCQEKNEVEESSLEKIEGKKLIFPSQMECDINDFVLCKSEKIISYVDGDCSSCLVDLRLWEKYIESFSNKLKPPMIKIIISTSNPDFIRHLVKENTSLPLDMLYFSRSSLYLPDSFQIKNEMEGVKKNLHTYLLDKGNRILLMGDPTKDSVLNKRYQEILLEKIN